MLSRRILVATDGSETSQFAERFAADLASAIGESEVVLATVVPHHDIPSGRGLVVEAPSDDEMASANSILNGAEERARQAMAGSKASVRTLLTTAHDPAGGIVEASEGPRELA